MGRLTLNVLLSFAQFEREVAGERIRDKIAASKKRGMWMGGLPPLGYDIANKQLVVNETESKTIQTIFEAYVRLGTVAKLKQSMDAAGVVSKRRISKRKTNGVETGTLRKLGGKPISRSGYHAMLTCHTYRGMIHHKGQVYEGTHKAIISEELWEAAQAQLTANTADLGLSRIGQKGERVREMRKLTGHHMLTGILFNASGERLSPSHATKRTKDGGIRRYFYYVLASLVRGQATSEGIRVSAPDLDSLVVATVKDHLTDRQWLADQLRGSIGTNQSASHHTALHHDDGEPGDVHPSVSVQHLHRAFEAGQAWANAITPKTARALLERVVVDHRSITITLHGRALREALQLDTDCHLPDTISITRPTRIIRDGKGTRMIFGQVNIQVPHVDQNLINQLKTAHHWADALFSGKHPSIAALARAERVDPSEVSRTITLAFLAPSITRTILKGTQPPSLTLDALRRARPLPPSWNEQEAMLQA
jgi:hypothetical protein